MTKQEILLSSNKKTRRGVSDIDDPLYATLVDISKRHPFLPADVSNTLDTDAKFTKPTDFAIDDSLFMVDANQTLPSITLHEYLNEIIPGYHIRGNGIFVGPKTTYASLAYTFYYGKKHGSDLDDIEFDDDFETAIVAGVTSKVFESFQMFGESREWMATYENEIQKLIDGTVDDMPSVEMRTSIRY